MNVSKLRSNETSTSDRPVAKSVYKKQQPEPNKPLTMAEALKERLMRRHRLLMSSYILIYFMCIIYLYFYCMCKLIFYNILIFCKLYCILYEKFIFH